MTHNLQLNLLTTTEEFLALEPEWNELLQDSAADNIFLTWEWVSTWWECFSQNTQPWIITVRDVDSQKLYGLAPLMRRKRTSQKLIPYQEISFIGSNNAAPDHIDFMIRNGQEDSVATELINFLWSNKSQWDILRLDGMTANSKIIPLLLAQTQTATPEITDDLCPYITLPDNWETYRSGLSKNLRYNIGRSGRKWEKEYPGQVACRQIEQEEELADAMQSLIDFHQEIRQQHGQEGSFSDEQMITFHLNIARKFLKNNWLRLYTLDIGGQTVAAIYSYHYNQIISFYQTGYNLDWKQLSPGQYIMAHAIEQAITNGAREFDFLRGDEPYKKRWTQENRRDTYLKIPSGIQGKMVMGAGNARATLGGLKSSIKATLKQKGA